MISIQTKYYSKEVIGILIDHLTNAFQEIEDEHCSYCVSLCKTTCPFKRLKSDLDTELDFLCKEYRTK